MKKLKIIRSIKCNEITMNLIKQIEPHFYFFKVVSIIQLNNSRYAMSTREYLAIINLNKKDIYEYLTYPPGNAIGVVKIDNGNIVSYNEKCVSIWKQNLLLVKLFTLQEGIKIEKVIALSHNRLGVGTNVGSLYIYDCRQLITSIRVHTISLTSIIKLKEKDILISSGRSVSLTYYRNDDTINIIDPSNWTWETILIGVTCCDRNHLQELSNGKIIVGGLTEIQIIDVKKKRIEIEINDTNIKYHYSFIELKSGFLLFSVKNNKMILLNLNSVVEKKAKRNRFINKITKEEGRFEDYEITYSNEIHEHNKYNEKNFNILHKINDSLFCVESNSILSYWTF